MIFNPDYVLRPDEVAFACQVDDCPDMAPTLIEGVASYVPSFLVEVIGHALTFTIYGVALGLVVCALSALSPQPPNTDPTVPSGLPHQEP